MHNYESEVPKHRKKAKYNNKKSNHKHQYVLSNIEHAFITNRNPNEENTRCMVIVYETCLVCEKEKSQMKFINYKEYLEMKNLLQ